MRSGPIRFARATRFAPPERTDPRRPEPHHGAICPQPPSRLEHVMGPGARLPQDEDCLALSVVSPADPGPHPVLVFLHGGAFTSGSGLLPWYDGARLAAEHGIVVVSVSYRLGPLGWLPLEGIAPANLGLLDQIAALEWIHDGIERFGGDPTRVCLAGQSAGALSTALLVDIPAVRPLVHRVVMQSGPPLESLPSHDPEFAARVGARFVELLDDDVRRAPAPELLVAAGRLAAEERERGPWTLGPPWGPTRGHHPLADAPGPPEDPGTLSVLIGWNRDEMTAFGVDPSDAPARSAAVMADPWVPTVARLRDAGAAVTAYRLDWCPAGSPFGATHCLELPLLLGDADAWRGSPMLGDGPWEARGVRLRAAWARFVHTGHVDPESTAGLDLAWSTAGDLDALRHGDGDRPTTG